MPKSNAARRLSVVHPASESRIERKAAELVDVRSQIKELEERKADLSASLLRMVKSEGEDAEGTGQIRYETDAHRFVIVRGASSNISKAKLLKLGVRLTTIEKATNHTDFEYVRVDERKAETEDEGA